MLDQLKNLQIDRIDLDDAVALAAFGRMVEAEYNQVGSESPTWLSDNLKELRKEVRQRLSDSIERELSEAKARLDALSTTEEKRVALREKIDRLTSKLGAGA